MRSLLQLNARPEVPVARLTVRHGKAKQRPDVRAALRVREDGTFKIVQISDMHMVTGVGVCNDAIDGHGKNLPDSEADPLPVDFVGKILDVERPDRGSQRQFPFLPRLEKRGHLSTILRARSRE